MAERFEICKSLTNPGRRKEDKGYLIHDHTNNEPIVFNLTKSQAESVKKALDEATGGKNEKP